MERRRRSEWRGERGVEFLFFSRLWSSLTFSLCFQSRADEGSSRVSSSLRWDRSLQTPLSSLFAAEEKTSAQSRAAPPPLP